MNLMAARVVVVKPSLPWESAGKWDADPENPWHEYRDGASGAPLVLYKVAHLHAGNVLAILWGLGPNRSTLDDARYPQLAPVGAALLLASWNCEPSADGTMRSSALEADTGALAAEVKAAWPAADAWRLRLPTDPQWNRSVFPPVAPTGPATGPCLLGVILQ